MSLTPLGSNGSMPKSLSVHIHLGRRLIFICGFIWKDKLAAIGTCWWGYYEDICFITKTNKQRKKQVKHPNPDNKDWFTKQSARKIMKMEGNRKLPLNTNDLKRENNEKDLGKIKNKHHWASQRGLLGVCVIWHDCGVNEGMVGMLILRSGPGEDKNRPSPSAGPLLKTHIRGHSTYSIYSLRCLCLSLHASFCFLSVGLFLTIYPCFSLHISIISLFFFCCMGTYQ